MKTSKDPKSDKNPGSGANDNTSNVWDSIRELDVAVTSSDWGTPERVNVSNDGWEEGVFVERDHSALYWIYTQIDIFALIFHSKTRVVGPLLDTNQSCFYLVETFRQNCGEYPRADSFHAVRSNDTWTAVAPAPLQLKAKWPIGGLHIIRDYGHTVAYFMSGAEDGVDNLGYAVDLNSDGVWEVEPQMLSGIAEAGYEDSDPWVSDDNKLMLFWSTRPDPSGNNFQKKNIWYSTNASGWADANSWSAPQIINSSKINSDQDDMMTFYHDGYLYFASARDYPTYGNLAIYRLSLTLNASADLTDLSNSAFGTPELVIHSNFAVGEPSITADGQYLYFEQIFWDGDESYNADIMFVKKR